MTRPPSWEGGPLTPPGFAPPDQRGDRPLAAPRRALVGTQRSLVALVVLFAVGLAARGVFSMVRQETRSASPVAPGRETFGEFPVLPTFAPSARPSASPARGPVPKPLRYNGNGTGTVRIGTLGEDAPSLLYVKARPAGRRLLVQEVRAGGGMGATRVVTFAPYEGVTVLDRDPAERATRTLRIEASGPWVVEVRSSRGAPAFGSRTIGRGDTVLRYTGRAGVGTVSGSTHVLVRVYREDGFLSGLMSAFDGRRTSEPWDAGPLLVEVDTDGTWTVDVRRG